MSESSTPPGWYPDVERAGGERWWDGMAWTEYRRAAGASPGMPPPPQQAPGGVWGQAPDAPAGYVAFGAGTTGYPESSKAGWALALSILGLFCCALTAIAGVLMGRSEMTAIDQGRVDPQHKGVAQAAFVVGIVVLSLTAGLLVLALIGAAAG